MTEREEPCRVDIEKLSLWYRDKNPNIDDRAKEPSPEVLCDECGGRTTITNGEHVCVDCGLVVEKAYQASQRRAYVAGDDHEKERDRLHGHRG